MLVSNSLVRNADIILIRNARFAGVGKVITPFQLQQPYRRRKNIVVDRFYTFSFVVLILPLWEMEMDYVGPPLEIF